MRAGGSGPHERGQSGDRSGHRQHPARQRGGCGARSPGRAARLCGLVPHGAGRARRAPDPRPCTRARALGADRAGAQHRDGGRHRLCAKRSGPARSRAHPRRARESGEVSLRLAARHHGDPARADRRLRPDHALELAALPDHRQGRPGTSGRLHGRTEAQRALATQRAFLRRDHGRGGLPAGRLQPRQRDGAGGRRGARYTPGGRHGLDHRLDAGGRSRRAGGGPHRQARCAGARRQVAKCRPAGCRSRPLRAVRRRCRHAQSRPVLQRAYAHAGPARATGRGRGPGQGSSKGIRRGRSRAGGDHSRHDRQSRPVRPNPGDDRDRHRGRREARDWRPRPA